MGGRRSIGSRKRPSGRGVTWSTVRAEALKLAGASEGVCYGTPALYLRRRFLMRLKEDGRTLALRISFDDRDALLQMDPETFYLTDHYRPYPAVLARLSGLTRSRLRELLERSAAAVAPPAKRRGAAGGRAAKAKK